MRLGKKEKDLNNGLLLSIIKNETFHYNEYCK